MLLSLEDICKYFKVSGGTLKAVDHVTFDIHKGETVGLVGESGCGKSTLGRVAMGIYPPTFGKLSYKGKEVNLKHSKDRFAYAKKAQIIFQDPYASLDPRMTVSSIIEEGMVIHKMYDEKRRKERVYELLEMVGLNREHANRFPHEFSGGQRQRIGIARALSMAPELIICDEPISALDVSIQAQVMNLLLNLQQEKQLSYIFIAHDLSMVRYISDTVAVMYLGSLMEYAPNNELYEHPQHPYTKALFSAIPVANPRQEKQRKRIELQGEIPSPIHAPKGCKFCTRCAYAKPVCFEQPPALKECAPGHMVACHAVNG